MHDTREETARLAYLAGVQPRPCGRFWAGAVLGIGLSIVFWCAVYLIARAVG